MKLFASILFSQIGVYFLSTWGYKAIAISNVPQALVADFMLASMTFFVIRKIANTEQGFLAWTAYTSGGIIGTWLGILFANYTM